MMASMAGTRHPSVAPGSLRNTSWSLIVRAREGNADALSRLWTRYRPVILRFALKRGLSETDAQDLTQDVLADLTAKDSLRKLAPCDGSFRAFLWRVVDHKFSDGKRKEGAEKRGKGRRPVALHKVEGFLSSSSRREIFDREWAERVTRATFEALAEECRDEEARYPQALHWYTVDEVPYAEVARRLGTTEANLKNIIRRARLLFVEAFRRVVMETCSSQPGFEEEARQLLSLIPPSLLPE